MESDEYDELKYLFSEEENDEEKDEYFEGRGQDSEIEGEDEGDGYGLKKGELEEYVKNFVNLRDTETVDDTLGYFESDSDISTKQVVKLEHEERTKGKMEEKRGGGEDGAKNEGKGDGREEGEEEKEAERYDKREINEILDWVEKYYKTNSLHGLLEEEREEEKEKESENVQPRLYLPSTNISVSTETDKPLECETNEQHQHDGVEEIQKEQIQARVQKRKGKSTSMGVSKKGSKIGKHGLEVSKVLRKRRIKKRKRKREDIIGYLQKYLDQCIENMEEGKRQMQEIVGRLRVEQMMYREMIIGYTPPVSDSDSDGGGGGGEGGGEGEERTVEQSLHQHKHQYEYPFQYPLEYSPEYPHLYPYLDQNEYKNQEEQGNESIEKKRQKIVLEVNNKYIKSEDQNENESENENENKSESESESESENSDEVEMGVEKVTIGGFESDDEEEEIAMEKLREMIQEIKDKNKD